MGLAESLATNEIARILLIKQLKKCKTKEQKQAIDFFFYDEDGCGGCLGKKIWKKDEYLERVSTHVNSLNLRQKAIEKIGLDESEIQEIEPIMLSSFVFNSSTYWKYFGDCIVSSKFGVTWLFFSAEQIYTYTYIFDMTGDSVEEITHDLFYTDITCFTTKTDLVENIIRRELDKNNKRGCLGMTSTKDVSVSNIKDGCLNTHVKRNYVVDTLEIDVPQTSFSFSMRNSENIERSLQAVKNMLRDKKYDK